MWFLKNESYYSQRQIILSGVRKTILGFKEYTYSQFPPPLSQEKCLSDVYECTYQIIAWPDNWEYCTNMRTWNHIKRFIVLDPSASSLSYYNYIMFLIFYFWTPTRPMMAYVKEPKTKPNLCCCQSYKTLTQTS